MPAVPSGPWNPLTYGRWSPDGGARGRSADSGRPFQPRPPRHPSDPFTRGGQRTSANTTTTNGRRPFVCRRSTPDGPGRGAVGGNGNASRSIGAEGGGNVFRRALTSYDALNTAHPTATKLGSTVVICTFGDVTAQRIQHGQLAKASRGDGEGGSVTPFKMDARRVVAFASFGVLYTGWFQMHWFRVLQSWFPRAPGAGAATFFSKPTLGPLLVNQLVMVPAGYYPFYFSWTGFVRGFSFAESKAAMREKYRLDLLARNWAFWLPAQGVQFAFVPTSYHILYVSTMGLAWNTILSLVTLSSAKK